MSEESDLEKTEAASPRRLEKAREDGDVVRSRELVTLVILGAGIAGIWLTSGSLSNTFGGALQHGLRFDRNTAFDSSHMLTQAGSMVLEGLLAIAPFLGMMMLAAFIGPLMLGGWLFSAKAIGPNFGKLNPLAGIGRMFSTQSLAELTKALAKSLLVGVVAWWVISGHVGDMVALMGEPAHRALPHAIRMIVVDCAVIAATLVIVAMIDVPYQLWSHAKKLRMSREDVRQENKESEGDPHVKANIRRMQQQAAKRRMMSEVPKADIVLTNPSHFSVALKYRDGDMRAPIVVAKGSDLVAQRIRELAKEHNVAVLEAPPLTRALFKHTRLGDEIPAGLYTAVAEVLAWVYQLKRWKDEGGDAPRTPSHLPVPSELQYNVSAA